MELGYIMCTSSGGGGTPHACGGGTPHACGAVAVVVPSAIIGVAEVGGAAAATMGGGRPGGRATGAAWAPGAHACGLLQVDGCGSNIIFRYTSMRPSNADASGCEALAQ